MSRAKKYVSALDAPGNAFDKRLPLLSAPFSSFSPLLVLRCFNGRRYFLVDSIRLAHRYSSIVRFSRCLRIAGTSDSVIFHCSGNAFVACFRKFLRCSIAFSGCGYISFCIDESYRGSITRGNWNLSFFSHFLLKKFYRVYNAGERLRLWGYLFRLSFFWKVEKERKGKA